MIWYAVDPFVECRIKFSYNMLLPVRPNKSKNNFGFVDRVLDKSSEMSGTP